jgi:excinuclease ABC subunit A
VVVIEHNLEVIKTADWVLDLGPEGGDKGGEIVAEGTPEDVAQEPRSYTGGYLKELLAKSVRSEAGPALLKKKRGSGASARQREAAE